MWHRLKPQPGNLRAWQLALLAALLLLWWAMTKPGLLPNFMFDNDRQAAFFFGEPLVVAGRIWSWFVTQRDMWTFAVASDAGVLELTITDEQSGTYALDGIEMSTLIEASEPPEVTMTVNGEPFVVPGGASPVAPPEAEFSGATVACDGGTLVATTEEFSSYWTRR